MMDPIEYARAYTGGFDFMVSMRQRVERGEPLSDRMLDAIKRCMARDVPPTPEPNGLDLSALPEGTTRHAVKGFDGSYLFLRIDRPKRYAWKGWTFVKRISGPHEERIGTQRPGGTYQGALVGALTKVLTNPELSMRRYGVEIGECGKCGKRLTDDVSRQYGIGPECRKMLRA